MMFVSLGYVRQPFKIWTATEPPKLGAVNYLTGMGGFLQSVISGYGGFRLYPEKIVFYKPRLPPNSTKLHLAGLSYLENIFDVTIEAGKVTISLRQFSYNHPLQISYENVKYEFGFGYDKIELENREPPITFSISAVPSRCPLPVDAINSVYTKENSVSVTGSFVSATFVLPLFFVAVANFIW